jgi:23S rRNA A2030 N6-methylase RlmJ
LGQTVHLHQEDGYQGFKASKLRPRLLLVDPPSTDWDNIRGLFRSLRDTSVVAWYPLHSSYVGKKGVPKISGQAEEFTAKTRVPVFQIQYGPAERNTRVMIGCGVAVGGMPERRLRCLKGLLPEVARELAASSVKEPFSSYNI